MIRVDNAEFRIMRDKSHMELCVLGPVLKVVGWSVGQCDEQFCSHSIEQPICLGPICLSVGTVWNQAI
jgi:hypothetical protein